MSTLEVTGKVAGIEQRSGGWRRILVEVPGKQYPVRLDTKKDEIIAQATEALEWPAATVRYTEADSGNPNPHRPGENYINRYLDGVLPVTPADLEKHEAAKDNGSQYWKPRDPGERLSIERQSAARTAFEYGAYAFAKAFTGTQTELELYLFGLATRLEAHVSRAAEDTPAGIDDERPPLTDADAPPDDSDVPFV